MRLNPLFILVLLFSVISMAEPGGPGNNPGDHVPGPGGNINPPPRPRVFSLSEQELLELEAMAARLEEMECYTSDQFITQDSFKDQSAFRQFSFQRDRLSQIAGKKQGAGPEACSNIKALLMRLRAKEMRPSASMDYTLYTIPAKWEVRYFPNPADKDDPTGLAKMQAKWTKMYKETLREKFDSFTCEATGVTKSGGNNIAASLANCTLVLRIPAGYIAVPGTQQEIVKSETQPNPGSSEYLLGMPSAAESFERALLMRLEQGDNNIDPIARATFFGVAMAPGGKYSSAYDNQTGGYYLQAPIIQYNLVKLQAPPKP